MCCELKKPSRIYDIEQHDFGGWGGNVQKEHHYQMELKGIQYSEISFNTPPTQNLMRYFWKKKNPTQNQNPTLCILQYVSSEASLVKHLFLATYMYRRKNNFFESLESLLSSVWMYSTLATLILGNNSNSNCRNKIEMLSISSYIL